MYGGYGDYVLMIVIASLILALLDKAGWLR